MEFSKFIEWSFYSLIAGGLSFFLYTLLGFKKSVDELNKNVAVLIEKSNWIIQNVESHEIKIHELQLKLTKLEIECAKLSIYNQGKGL